MQINDLFQEEIDIEREQALQKGKKIVHPNSLSSKGMNYISIR